MLSLFSLSFCHSSLVICIFSLFHVSFFISFSVMFHSHNPREFGGRKRTHTLSLSLFLLSHTFLSFYLNFLSFPSVFLSLSKQNIIMLCIYQFGHITKYVPFDVIASNISTLSFYIAYFLSPYLPLSLFLFILSLSLSK